MHELTKRYPGDASHRSPNRRKRLPNLDGRGVRSRELSGRRHRRRDVIAPVPTARWRIDRRAPQRSNWIVVFASWRGLGIGEYPHWGTRSGGVAGDKNSMLICRRPSAATLVAIVATLAIGSQTGLAAGSSAGSVPMPVSSVEVTATDGSSVTIAWPASRDTDVAGYGVYVNGAQVGTQTPDQVKRWRDRDVALVHGRAACLRHGLHGRGRCVRSRRPPLAGHLDDGLHLGVSGRDGPLGTDRGAPGGGDGELGDAGLVSLVGQRRCGRVRALRVRSAGRELERCERDAHEPCLRHQLPGRDRRGRRRGQPLRAGQLVLRTSACPSTNKPPSTPTGLKVTAATRPACRSPGPPRRTMSRSRGYGLYVAGKRTTDTTKTSADFTGLQCGTTYALGVDAFDAAGKRSTVTELSTATSPCAPHAAADRDGHGHPDDRQRGDALRRRQLARRLRQQRRQGRGRPRLDRVLRRRHPGALRDQPALRRHRRLLGLHQRQRRPAHLPGARPQRRRHRPRHQHRHRHRRQQDTSTAAADHTAPSPRRSPTGPPSPAPSTGAPSTTRTATRSRTTPARSVLRRRHPGALRDQPALR